MSTDMLLTNAVGQKGELGTAQRIGGKGGGGVTPERIVNATGQMTPEQGQQTRENLFLDGYVTPEMFGAKGDGVADDTESIEMAFHSGCSVVLLKRGATYLVTNPIIRNVNDLTIIGYGATVKVNPDFEFVSYIQRVCLFVETSNNIILEGLTFDGSWREIKAQHNLDVDTTLENYCVRLLGGNDGITFNRCVFGNQLKVCIQSNGSYLGGALTNIDPNFVPNKNIDIGNCLFGWNYEPGLHNGAIQFLELPSVSCDVNLRIHDNTILKSGVHGIHIYYGNNNVDIRNNIVLNSGYCMKEEYYAGGGNPVRGYGIEITSCHDISIANNDVVDFIAGGIAVFDDAWFTDGDIYNVNISKNTVKKTSGYSTEFEGHGILVQHASDIVIAQNMCENINMEKSSTTVLAGICFTNSERVIVSNNLMKRCECGVITNTANKIVIESNIVMECFNAYNKASNGIQFFACSGFACSGNEIYKGNSDTQKNDGITLNNVSVASVSGNVLGGLRYAIKDNSGFVTNATVYGNIFDAVTNKYVWWGKHTDLIVDFAAVANN